MYLLDTDTIIYSLKGNKNVQQHLNLHINDPLAISIITLMELYYGAYKSQNIETNLAKIKAIENHIEVIPDNQECAEVFARIKTKLEKQGNRLDDFDLIIAACALTHNLTLVTNNTKHFNRISGLNYENWTITTQ